MGLFDLFSSLTPLSAAERIRDAALSLHTTRNEEAIALALGVELHILVGERLLVRMGVSEASVGYFYMMQPHPRVRELKEHLEKMFLEYMLTRPGVPKDFGRELYARARREYVIQQPHEFAAKLLTNLYNGDYKPVESSAQASFLELVHGYVKGTMVQVGELAKRLRE